MTAKTAKLDVKDLLPFGMLIVVTGLVLSLGSQVNGDVRKEHCEDGAAGQTYNGVQCLNSTGGTDNVVETYGFNVSSKSMEGAYNLSAKMPTVGTVVAVVVVIGLLLSGFAYLMHSRR